MLLLLSDSAQREQYSLLAPKWHHEHGADFKLPDRPGIGFEAQNALYKVMRELVVRG